MTLPVEALQAAVERGVRAAQRAGAEDAEVYLWSARSWETREAGRLRTVQESDGSGVNVRVRVDGRRVSVISSGLRDEDITWAVERAVSLARLMPRSDTPWHLPTPEESSAPPTPVDRELTNPRVDRLLGVVEESLRVFDAAPWIDYRAGALITSEGTFVVGNTNGLLAWDRHAHESFTCELRAEGQGEFRTMTVGLQARRPVNEAHDIPGALRSAIELVRVKAQAVPLASPVNEVVFDSHCAWQLLQGLLPSFAGNAANAKRSRFASQVGAVVASEAFTLTDDSSDPTSIRCYRYDDQGSPSQGALPLVERGILRNHVHDLSSALQAGAAPTGHGLRGAVGRYVQPPKTTVANARVAPGDHTLQELVETCEKGVLVEGGLLGHFTLNSVTGDFSCTAPLAHLVERGRVTAPLKPVTLGGNLFDLLREVRALGRDLQRFSRGACPSVRAGGLTAST
ncbi:MAG TPA: metallopeptidase TldD-related protein [Candidatus Thermoplasmatota archaeon]|nr:metallopeptidase TldD-related protein [Candidatus Thermoplasmatota archaeon]